MAYLYRHIRLDRKEPFYIGIGEDLPKNESKYKRANSLKGKKHSKEWSENIGKGNKGISRNKGKKRTEEQVQRMSQVAKGRPKSEETRLKMSESKKGIPKSEETKQRMRKPHKEGTGAKISKTTKGTPKSEETKRKMRKHKNKKLKL